MNKFRKLKPKTVKVSIAFEMDERTAKLFLQSAIERVINTSIKCVEKADDDDAQVNVEDWNEWKPVVVTMWTGMHDKVFRALANMEDDHRVFTLSKGD